MQRWIGPRSAGSSTESAGPSESREKITVSHQGREERYLGDEACNVSTGEGLNVRKRNHLGGCKRKKDQNTGSSVLWGKEAGITDQTRRYCLSERHIDVEQDGK